MTSTCETKSVKLTTILFAATMSVLAACTAEPPPLTGTAIEHVTVIDARTGESDPARTDQRVIIVGDRIHSVSAMSDPAPVVTDTIDATGRFLIPGLWDMHVHFLYDPALTDGMPDQFLRYGITSVRDTGGELEPITRLRNELLASGRVMPRIFLSGPLLDGRFVVYDGADPGQPPLGTGVPDQDAARAQVRALAAAGVDFIKIYELVDPVVFTALVEEARLLGLPIASHVPLTMTADTAGPAVDSMEHLRNIELACAADWQALLEVRRTAISAFVEGRGFELRRELHALQRLPAIAAYDEARCDEVLDTLTQTLQVPTLRLNTVAMTRPFEREDWPAALAALPATTQRDWMQRAEEMTRAAPVTDHAFSEWSLFLISRLLERSVPIGAGTDTPIGLGIPGYSLHTELELLVKGGLTPLQALRAATIAPAQFFGREDDMSLIEAGMAADLVLLDADPLLDIANTRRIHRVMAAGRWVPDDV